MADMDATIKRGHPILFGLLLFFAFIEGCTTAWLVTKYNNNDNYPSSSIRDRTRFLVFTSWWTVIFCALYLAAFITGTMTFLTSIASHGAFLFLTWLFWMAGVAALTQSLGGGQRCSQSTLTYCNQLVAAEAFGWIEWILMSVVLILVVVLGSAALRRGDRLTGPLSA